jgi:peptidoglycan/xylan/chitin deacetylase (PgdA/CDA1 family)
MLESLITTHRPEQSLVRRARRALNAAPALRHAAIFGLSLTRSPLRSTGWVRFLMYHDVAQGEQTGLERQLRYVKSLGDFVSADAALDIIEGGGPCKDRYFCVTLDDGYEGAARWGFPIFAALGVPAVYFVVPAYINAEKVPHRPKNLPADAPLAFLTWDDCRRMGQAGMTIGSHSYSHARLSALDPAALARELADSKAAIERETGRPCTHFAAPWGQPRESFDPDRDPQAARAAGYRSFFTTVRGRAAPGKTSPLAVPREKIEPSWGLYNLKYFLSL